MNGYPKKNDCEQLYNEGNPWHKLFISNVKIIEDFHIHTECQAWLEENVGVMWIDWAWPTACVDEDHEQWILMIFKKKEDVLRFKLVWG